MVFLLLFIFLNIIIVKQNMQAYCVSCRKNIENKNEKMIRTKNGRLQMKSSCSVCGNTKSRFLKKQEAEGILSFLGIRTALSKIPG